MSPSRSRSLHVWVAEDCRSLVESLTGHSSDGGPDVAVESVDVDALEPEDGDLSVDCVVLSADLVGDGGPVTDADAVVGPETPVVVVAPEDHRRAVRRAAAVDAAGTLPADLVTEEPALAAERLASLVRRTRNGGWTTETDATGDRSGRTGEDHEKYSTLVEQSSDGVVVVQDGEYVFVNERFAEITGYDRADLVGRPFDEVFTPAYRELVRERYRERVAGESPPNNYDVEVETAAGEVRTLSLAVSRVEHAGEPATMATFRDVTDRKRRERAVRALEDATERMQEVDTAERVAEIAVETARDALDLPLAMCWFDADADLAAGADGDDGLVPVAATDAIHEAGLHSGLDADRYEYDVFREGTVTTYSPRERTDENPLASAVLLPLSEYGLVAAGRHEHAEYDDVTLDVAGALAEHTTTALERVERAREVRERERRLRLIAEHIDQAIYLAAPDFSEVVYVNDAYEDIWGRPADELYADPMAFVEHIDGRDRADFEAEFDAMRVDIDAGDPEEVYEFDFRVRRPDDEVRWVHATGHPVTTDDGTVYVGTATDVTERRELERTYRSVFESVSDGLVLHDPETGEITDVNDRFCEMNGYDRGALVGETIDVVTAPAHEYDRAREMIERAREGDSQLFEWRNERADGTTYPVEVHLSVVDIRGAERVLASVRDVTERKRREREYEQIFDAVNDVINVYDPATGDLVAVNDTLTAITGYDRERILEEGLDLVSATDEGYDGERAAEIIDDVVAAGESRELEWQLETADGERRWLDVKATPATINGEDRVLTISRDVTERRQREREYEQIFDGVTDAITVHDPETAEILDCNDRMCELTGYDRSTLLEEGMAVVNVPEEGYDSDRARSIIREVMASGETRTLEWLIERADGERRWVEINATPGRLDGEERYLAIMRDVTERRRSERRLRTILDRIDEAIYMNEAREVTSASQSPDYVSSGYEAIWGQSLEEIRDTYEDGFFGTLHPDDEAEYRAFVESIVRDVADGAAADSYSREYRIQRPDGEVRWVQSDYYPVEWAGGPPRVVIVSRDITARKERERRIASFEAATEDLTTADDAEEAARLAVDAATDTLGLSAVGAFLYDDDAGVLRPDVRSADVPEGVGTRPVSPGDGPLWEAFATGTVVDPDGAGPERARTADGGVAGEADGLDDWRAVALGNHGVLLVGTPEGTLDPDTLQAAHVLAATLEAALNHLQGQQRLAVQEEQLRTQTERADRLDRIARLTQDVEAAITEASEPAAVNRAVCDRLADSGPYEAAWVGGVEVGADRLSPRAVVGASRGYVDGLDLSTTDGSADPHPAVRAWQDDEVAVADSLVGGGPAGEWRRRALAEGYQSLCAVPLTYDGTTRGVLVVASAEPNAFGEREREVLGGLGRSVGYALAAIERRRALESDETVELEFAGEGAELGFARLAREADCTVRHDRTVPRDDGSVSVTFAVDGATDGDRLVDLADPVLSGTVDVAADARADAVLEVVTDTWFGSELAEYGAVLRRAAATPDETTVVVEVPAGADVRSFADRLAGLAPSLELVAKRHHRQQDRTPAELHDRVEAALTDRQYEVLRTALSAGYFAWPREHDGSEVADRLGITQPTFNKHLRLGERKTFELLFDEE